MKLGKILISFSLDFQNYVKGHNIVPAFINSDIIENISSQQRGFHHDAGSNTKLFTVLLRNEQYHHWIVNYFKEGKCCEKTVEHDKWCNAYNQLCKHIRLNK